MALRRTTIGELGQKLPIGLAGGSNLIKDFSLRPYKSKIDRLLGDWTEANAGKHKSLAVLESARVAKFVSLICSQYGDKALGLTPEGDSTPESELMMYSRWYADIMYIYIYSRIQSLGPDLEVRFTCPSCGKPSKAIFDLNTAEVDVIDTVEDLEKWITLARPIRNRNGQRINKIKVRPSPWSTMLKPGVFSGNIEQVAQAGLIDCICGTDAAEGESTLTQSDIDDVEKIDMLRINHQTQDLAAGIIMKTSIECPHKLESGKKCSFSSDDALDWTLDYFFGSSLPM